MADQWFYAKQGKQLGPVPLEQLQKALAKGDVQPSDLVWCEGMPQWTPAAHVKELAGNVSRASAPAAPPSPPAAGKPRKAEPAGPPQPAPAAPAPGGGENGGGPLSLFDLRFKRFFTPSLVKLIWLLYVIAAPLWYLIDVGRVTAEIVLRRSPLLSSLKWIAADLVQFCFLTLAVRLALEGVLVLFRIADDLREIRQRQPGENPPKD